MSPPRCSTSKHLQLGSQAPDPCENYAYQPLPLTEENQQHVGLFSYNAHRFSRFKHPHSRQNVPGWPTWLHFLPVEPRSGAWISGMLGPCYKNFEVFSKEMKKGFWPFYMGREAGNRLLWLHQGSRSAYDYAIHSQDSTLSPTEGLYWRPLSGAWSLGMLPPGASFFHGFNSLPSASTGLSPFQCCLGYQPPCLPAQEAEVDVPSVQHFVCCCKRTWLQARRTLLQSSNSYKRQADTSVSRPRSTYCELPTKHNQLFYTNINTTFGLCQL